MIYCWRYSNLHVLQYTVEVIVISCSIQTRRLPYFLEKTPQRLFSSSFWRSHYSRAALITLGSTNTATQALPTSCQTLVTKYTSVVMSSGHVGSLLMLIAHMTRRSTHGSGMATDARETITTETDCQISVRSFRVWWWRSFTDIEEDEDELEESDHLGWLLERLCKLSTCIDIINMLNSYYSGCDVYWRAAFILLSTSIVQHLFKGNIYLRAASFWENIVSSLLLTSPRGPSCDSWFIVASSEAEEGDLTKPRWDACAHHA